MRELASVPEGEGKLYRGVGKMWVFLISGDV